MQTVTLPQAIRIVAELNPDDQQALYDYLSDTLPTHQGRTAQVAGTLGTSMSEEEGDRIADLLAEVRQERADHFNEEWPA